MAWPIKSRRSRRVVNNFIKPGGMLSSSDFRKLVIREDITKKRGLFINRKWGKLGKESKGFIIDPFDPMQLTPFSYDLCIGDQAVSCKKEIKAPFPLRARDENQTYEEQFEAAYKLMPRETIIIKTKEYIALPPCYSATVWPRLNFVSEGIFQSMVKIDPTWYGHLGVAITNLSPALYPIWKDECFGTLVIYELNSKTDITLCPPNSSIPPIEIRLDGLDRSIIDQAIAAIAQLKLTDKCKINQDSFTLRGTITPQNYKKLYNISENSKWKSIIEDSMIIKECPALGLPNIALLFSNEQKGQRLDRSILSKIDTTESKLNEAAIEHGIPFDLIAGIPRMVENRVKGQVEELVQKVLDKEMGVLSRNMIALMISVLGTLSIIIAIIALLSGYFQFEFPGDIDFKSTTFLVALFAIIIYSLVYLFFIRRDKKSVATKKELNDLEKVLREEIDILKNGTGVS